MHIYTYDYIRKYKALAFLWAFSDLKVRLVTERPRGNIVCVPQPQR